MESKFSIIGTKLSIKIAWNSKKIVCWNIFDNRTETSVKIIDIVIAASVDGAIACMTVDLGLPSKSAMIILDEILSMLDKFSIAFGDNKRPTPPMEALT